MENNQIKKGGRRSRRVNMWAKAAGEYYHSHKNDPNIKEFRDVLKSPDFKAYYHSKYGKGKKYVQKPEYTKKNNMSKTFKKSRRNYQDDEEPARPPRNKYDDEEQEQEEEPEEEYNPKMKTKKGNKTRKSESGWKWGGVKGQE